MIRVKIGDATVECDTPAEASEVIRQTMYTPGQLDIISKALCKAGTHTRAQQGDTNHCVACGTCMHPGMC